MYEEEKAAILEHYGVKGMRWGQRKSRDSGTISKRMAKKDSRWEKKAGSTKTTLAVYNKTADYMNKVGLNQLNNDPQFKGKDLTKDPKLMTAYNKRHEEIYTKAYSDAAKSFKSPSGSKQLNAKVNGDYLEITVEEVKHADNGQQRYFLVRNETGHVVEMINEEDILAQIGMASDSHLEHYGVKGMKWGVRKKKSQRELREEGKRKKLVKNRRNLSDTDLKNYIDRLEKEKKLKTLVEEDLSPGKAVAKRLMSESGQRVLKTVGTGAALYAVKAALTKEFNLKDAAGYLTPKPKNK